MPHTALECHTSTMLYSDTCPRLTTQELGVFVTTADKGGGSSRRDIVAPSAEHISNTNLWWTPFDDNWSDSDELTFSKSAQTTVNPIYGGQASGSFPKASYLLWYGEDLGDRSQSDNGVSNIWLARIFIDTLCP